MPSSPATTHAEQIEAACAIVRGFQFTTVFYALLAAHTQSGKSGCFHYVARLMLGLGMVDYVNIVCPSAEVELREQAESDALDYNPTYVREGKMTVTFHTAFKTARLLPTKKTLWIIDESHLDQDKGQGMDEFLKSHGINLFGSSDKMIADKTYILSVSATPYSELSGILHNHSLPKSLVFLNTGAGYIGAKDYYKKGLIHPTFNITEEPERFFDLLRDKGNKYSLIRLTSRSDETTESFLRKHCESNGIELVFFTQDTDELWVTKRKQVTMMKKRDMKVPASPVCLEDEPDVPTLIVLKGRLRCGKVVPKEHIGLVWEDSQDPNTDTIIQSLLGRMCGYKFSRNAAGEPVLPDIYLPPSLLEGGHGAMKSCEIQRAFKTPLILPRNGRNLVAAASGRKAALSETSGTVPLYLPAALMRSQNADWDDLSYHKKADAALAYLQSAEGLEMIQDSHFYTQEQKTYIQTYAADWEAREMERRVKIGRQTERLHAPVMTFSGDSSENAKKFFRSVKEGYKNQEMPSVPFRYQGHHNGADDPLFTFCVPCADWEKPRDIGDIYVYVTTRGSQKLKTKPLAMRIPSTTGTELFMPDAVMEVTGDVGGCGMWMTKAAASNAALFEVQMGIILERWWEGVEDPDYPQMTQELCTLVGQPIRLSAEAFGGPEGFRALLSTIQRNHSVKFGFSVKAHNEKVILLNALEWRKM